MIKIVRTFTPRTEKLYKLHKILKARKLPITKKDLADKIGCPLRTLDRVLQDYKNNYNNDLKYCGKSRGWYINGN